MRTLRCVALGWVLAVALVCPAATASSQAPYAVYLAWVTTRPAVPQPGVWQGGGCGRACNDIGFVVSPDATSISLGYIQAGRDRMGCQAVDIVDGKFTLICGGGGVGTVTGRFDSRTQVSGHYVADWGGFAREEADWTGEWQRP